MRTCNSTNAKNQTWELLGTGQLALADATGIVSTNLPGDLPPRVRLVQHGSAARRHGSTVGSTAAQQHVGTAAR